MAPSVPPRRFAPEPVETTSKSSKDKNANGAEQKEEKPAVRRFAPEPVETSSKSSKNMRNQPETGDLTQPKTRRFAPQPVETSRKSSKDKNGSQSEQRKPRKFAPEPMETSSTSSKGRSQDSGDKPKVRRFTPQPEETSHSSSKGRQNSGRPQFQFTAEQFSTTRSSNRGSRQSEDVAPDDAGAEKKAPRKFAPILLNTAQRSRRAADNRTSFSQADKTEYGHQLHAQEHRRHITGHKTPGHQTPFHDSDDDTDMADADSNKLDVSALHHSSELRRPRSPLDGRSKQSRFTERSHSFRLPDLDTIESSESEPASQTSSLSSSPHQDSPITISDSSFNQEFKHATRIRESVDENFSHYLLQLEAKRAEERLREQALAAFPNSDFHEPVQHYVNADDDTESEDSLEDRPATWEGHEDEIYSKIIRRESTAKIPWEQLEMQRHAERMEQDRKANQTTRKQSSQSPWWNPSIAAAATPNTEMQSMQDRARPPMLGDDLRFPRCRSPEPARFDVTQGSTALRNQMCYLSEQSLLEASQPPPEPALWQHPNPPKKDFTSIKTPTPSAQNTLTNNPPPTGLWGGFCVSTAENLPNGLAPPSQPTGLMTPAFEPGANPFDKAFKVPNGAPDTSTPGLVTPPTPSRAPDLSALDAVLAAERDLDETMARDYPDSFVTQVYNYLSLGYPTLARPFDEELSKISRFSIAELRQDDKTAKSQPRGYIRLGEDFEGGGGEVRAEGCVRWRALKVYIREWARQEKDMVCLDGVGGVGGWGTGARRGSWAI